VKRMIKAAIVVPIIKFSAFAIFPSRRGRVVRRAKITVAAFISLFFYLNSAFASFQKRTIVIRLQKASIVLNQKTFPAIAAKI